MATFMVHKMERGRALPLTVVAQQILHMHTGYYTARVMLGVNAGISNDRLGDDLK